MKRALADRGVQAGLILAAIAAAGFASLGLAWRGAAATLGVYTQLPFIVSGAIGGIALAGAFLGLLSVHVERRSAAVDRLWLEATIKAAAEISESLPPVIGHQARRQSEAPSTRGARRRGGQRR